MKTEWLRVAKPTLYDEDNNEIVAPEGATGLVVGEHGKWAWTYDKQDDTTEFIYTPPAYTGPMAENVEETFKFAEVPRITNDTWYLKLPRKKVRMKLRRMVTRG